MDKLSGVRVSAEALRARGLVLEDVVFRRGEYIAVAVRQGEPPVLGVEGRGRSVGGAIAACLDSWNKWRGVDA